MLGKDAVPEGRRKFSNEANLVYKMQDLETLFKDENKHLVRMILHHQNQQRPRLNTLREYYKGDNESILHQGLGKRRREEHLADNRATHNFAKYVSQFIQGYMLGVPLKTSHPKKETDEKIREINRLNDADEHNSELVLDQSIYGRAYEMVYRDKSDITRFILLDPMETFVVYDETVEERPLCAVRYIGQQFEEKLTVQVYTDKSMFEYSLDLDENLEKKDEKSHYFKEIQIVEYENNKYRQGDFEDVLALIDLYDNAQSDTANYMQDLNDAMLVIKGNLELDVEQAKNMKEKNIMFLQTKMDVDGRHGNADADYIYKKYDVAGTEAYKDRIFNNILLFTSIPNLLDDQSNSSPQSGEALKMKLFALSQKRATKERLFKKGLRSRYRLINAISNVAKEVEFNVNDIGIIFTENLPSMIDKELEWFSKMGGKLSNDTLLDQLSFIENAEEENKKIKEENALNKDLYAFDTNTIPKGAQPTVEGEPIEPKEVIKDKVVTKGV